MLIMLCFDALGMIVLGWLQTF